jgi:sugar lactone lactonase YvrE
MSRTSSSSHARVRVRFACAALAALCAGALTACGPGGPKQKTADDGGDNGGNTGPSRGITLVAGSATLYGSRDDKGAKATFNTPRGIVVDASGNLFVADELNRVIRKIAPDGTVSTFAGAAGVQGSINGNGTRARFTDPTALAIDAGGNLFVLDGYLIRKITSSADVTTLTELAHNGIGDNLRFHPAGIAVNASGDLFVTTVTDTSRLQPSRYQVANTLESGSAIDYGLADGVLTPRGIAVDANGVVYVADLRYTISSATTGAAALMHLAGVQGRRGHQDGSGSTALFNQIVALTVAKDGAVYAADAQSNTIRKIAANGDTSTLAGRDGATTLVTGGLNGSLANVAGIASDANGYLYVTTGNAVVKIVP